MDYEPKLSRFIAWIFIFGFAVGLLFAQCCANGILHDIGNVIKP